MLRYHAEINTAGNKFRTDILCLLRFKTIRKAIQCCSTSMGYKEFGPANLCIYTTKIFQEEGKLCGIYCIYVLMFQRSRHKTLWKDFFSVYFLIWFILRPLRMKCFLIYDHYVIIPSALQFLYKCSITSKIFYSFSLFLLKHNFKFKFSLATMVIIIHIWILES